MNKRLWLDAAELFDYWRIVPRLILFGYAWWMAFTVDRILNWYMLLPAKDRSVEAAGLAGAVITAVTGLGTLVYKIYSDNGRDLNAAPSIASEETTLTQTKTKPAKAK